MGYDRLTVKVSEKFVAGAVKARSASGRK